MQPSTSLFWDFCNDALAELQKYPVYHQFEVTKLRWDKRAGKYPFRLISVDNEGFRSRCVILAIGSEDCAHVPPEFAKWQHQYPGRIVHASQFSVDYKQRVEDSGKTVIVGGGLTAGTLARSLSEHGHHVVLIARQQPEDRAVRFSTDLVRSQSTCPICKRNRFSAAIPNYSRKQRRRQHYPMM